MTRILRDLRYAFRALVRTPGFTATVLITIGIGTGTNATVFSFVDALLFRPAAGVAHASSLLALYTSDYSSGPYGETSFPDFESIRTGTHAFAQVAAADNDNVAALRVGDDALRVSVAAVTGDFFSVLGVQASHGRVIQAGDASASATPVAVISHRLWQRAFHEDASALSTAVNVNGRMYEIVGVAAADFKGLDVGRATDLWIPLVAPPNTIEERDRRRLSVIGRLTEGASLAEAQRELDALSASLAAAYPKTNLGTLAQPNDPRPIVVRWHTRLDPSFRSQVAVVAAIILGATALVLMIACANVASLLLSRATARGREMAVRLALGASRTDLVRQLLCESALIAVGGAALGVLFGLWTVGALPSFFPPEQAELLDVRIDVRVLTFTTAIAILSAIIVSLMPAFGTRGASPVVALRGDRGLGTRSGGRLGARNVLVVGQVGLACVLLVGTGLLVKSLGYALRADLGFAARSIAIASVDIPSGLVDQVYGSAYYRDGLQNVRAVPGIEDAAWVLTLPMSGGGRRGFQIEGYQPAVGEGREHTINTISPEYFRTMRIPILAGRAFDERDTAASPPVAIVNDAFAKRYFGGAAVGRHLTDSRRTTLEIVGVVRTGKYRDLQEAPLPVVFYPLSQSYFSRMKLVARSTGDPHAMLASIREALRHARSDVPVYQTLTLDEHLGEVLAAERLTTALVTACSGLAIVLAMVGVYGVMAYAVVRRTREIGVRVALGARPGQIVSLVFSSGLRLTVIGMAIGLGASAIASGVIGSMLHGVSARDVSSFAIAPAALALMALLAAVVPVRRALRVDPIVALRQE
ncbi:MAG TPA: ABC transporter permease [Vicinamibacterales bacterium]|nr:ABC transporter permease [Vicinamibacterales bacterium]